MIELPTQERFGAIELRRTIWVMAAVWCGAILASPILQIDAIYAVFSNICHQMSERSWHLAGHPLPVCVRCASIYLGGFFALTLHLPAHPVFLRFALAAMAFEFTIARFWIDWEPTRAISGLLLGLAAAGFIESGIVELLERRSAEQPKTYRTARSSVT